MFIFYFKPHKEFLLGSDEGKLVSLVDGIRAEIRQNTRVNELSTLLRYSQVITLVVEDRDDVRIYNRLIERHPLGTYKVDVLAAHGRENFLRLYERRSEFGHAPIIFLANRGMWLFSGVPKDYADIVCSKGYSIENDIYLEDTINYIQSKEDYSDYILVQEAVIKWFAFEVGEYVNTQIQRGTPDLEELISDGKTELNKDFLKRRGFHFPKTKTIENLKVEYRLQLPGKLLFKMLERFSDFSLNGLYNTALAKCKEEDLPTIEAIRKILGEHGAISSQEVLPKPKKQEQIQKNQNQHPQENKSTSKSETLVGRLVKRETVTENNADILEKLIEQDKSECNLITSRDELLHHYRNRQYRFLSVYVVDQEMRVFSETSECYLNIIWTKGYSLENDLYIDGNLENLIDPYEKWKHRQVLNAVIKWFAFEVEKFFANETLEIHDVNLSDIVPPGRLELDKKFCETHNFREPPVKRIRNIKKEYERLLPGRFLFQILIRFLNTPGRSFNYKTTFQRLSYIALSANSSQQLLYELAEDIRAKLNSINDLIESEKTSTESPKNDSKTENHYRSTDKIEVGDKINVKILKKEGSNLRSKVTVKLMTNNHEEITFESPYYPGEVGEKRKVRVTSVDNDTGKITKVVP